MIYVCNGPPPKQLYNQPNACKYYIIMYIEYYTNIHRICILFERYKMDFGELVAKLVYIILGFFGSKETKRYGVNEKIALGFLGIICGPYGFWLYPTPNITKPKSNKTRRLRRPIRIKGFVPFHLHARYT